MNYADSELVIKSFNKGLGHIFLPEIIKLSWYEIIMDNIYHPIILTAILVCAILSYRRLIAIGYIKKNVQIFSFLTFLLAFPLGAASSKLSNMFYYSPQMWSLSFFVKKTFYDNTYTFHACWFLPLTASILIAQNLKIKISEMTDSLFLYLPIGHAIGRLACLFIGCCWGKRISCTFGNTKYWFNNPVPLYAIIANIMIFFILRMIYNSVYLSSDEFKMKRARFSGIIPGLYLIIYGIYRFGIEYIRLNPIVAFGLTQAQLAMIFYVFSGLLICLIIAVKSQKYAKIQI